VKIGNDTSIGIATIGEWAVAGVLVAVFLWRSSEGETFAETTTWLVGLGAAVTAVLSGLRRTWSGRNNGA
jgi:hypothetical protein